MVDKAAKAALLRNLFAATQAIGSRNSSGKKSSPAKQSANAASMSGVSSGRDSSRVGKNRSFKQNKANQLGTSPKGIEFDLQRQRNVAGTPEVGSKRTHGNAFGDVVEEKPSDSKKQKRADASGAAVPQKPVLPNPAPTSMADQQATSKAATSNKTKDAKV